jgi:formylmethanofuran dehydrogenase subunit E-like metal-binding protein
MVVFLCDFHEPSEGSTMTVEQIGGQAVQTATTRLNPKPDSELACITNAGYVMYKGKDTRILFDIIPKNSPISLGRGNLLPVHCMWDEDLWFAFLKKGQKDELLMTYVSISEDKLQTSEPINVHIKKKQSFAPFKRVLGKKTFSLVTLANGWADNIPQDLLNGALYHDHLCSGVFSGYFTVQFIQKHIPLQEGERYYYIGAPAWCQDDYLITPLNLTPGKRGYFTMGYPWYRPWKTKEKTYDKLGGIIIRYHNGKNIGRAYLLRFDWRENDFKKYAVMPDLKLDWKNHPWLHVEYNRFFLKHLDQPEFFVSILKKKPLENRKDLERLINMGATPLAEMLGQDKEWGRN